MSFGSIEASRAKGRPVNFFHFRYGVDPLAFEAYTDGEQTILAPGSLEGEAVPYEPKPISRANITSSGTLDKQMLEIRLPRDAGIVDQFVVFPPSSVVTCIIRQGHLGETEDSPPVLQAPVEWAGRVLGVNFEFSQAVLQCEPIVTSMRRTGLRRHYQRGCPHALYRSLCRADKEAATVTVNVEDVGTSSLVMPADWFGSIPVAKYLGGVVEWTTAEGNTEIRTILRITNGKDLQLNGFVRGLEGGSPGDPVQVSLGCNHLQDDCLSLHKEIDSGSPLQPNIHNYGGQDWIPTNNPFGFDNQFW